MEILIVEDEIKIANTLKKSLIKEGHFPTIAINAEVALELINEAQFDIILLDWRLPKLSGMEFCKQLRRNGNKTPIILLTALTDVSNKIEALEAGADDYITKPFSFEEVKARINAVLRRYRANQNAIQIGDMIINLVDRTVESEKDIIKLSDREFELLKYFLYNKGSIINKEKICKDVWGIEFNPFTNVIEVTIKNLRKKLEQNSKHIFIKTIYGEGYLFIAE
ncbi:MAG: response regulator transcription factor [Ignavibacteria bacterium]|nr:response regulator transcription factor [Ignavibacteria bacterium]